MRKLNLNIDYFKSIDNEEKAYWLGFLMADGCICKTNKNGSYDRIIIPLKSSDEGHLLKFKTSLSYEGSIKTKTATHNTKGFTYTTSQLRINSKSMCDDLIKYGVVPNKTGKENLPNLNPQLTRHFIRGFFDGDGSVMIKKNRNTGRVSIGSASLEILENINKFLINNVGINFPIYKENRYSIPFYKMDSCHKERNMKFLSFIYDDSTIYLNRKFNKYIELYCPPTQRCVENNLVNCGESLRDLTTKYI